MFLLDTFLYFNMRLIIYFFAAIFHPCYNSCISIKNIFYRYFESQSNTTIDSLSSHPYTNVMICKLKKFGSHFTSVQRRSQKIRTDEDENRKIAAEALKKLDEVNNFIEVNGTDHLNMIFNELIENVEQMKLKNQKQSNIRSFLRH